MDVYIDESGDAGTGGKGSKWLTLAAVCCRSSDIAGLEALVSSTATKLGNGSPKTIHFTDLPARDRRGIADAFGGTVVHWTGITVVSDTTLLLPNSGLSKPMKQYNYTLRYVLERVSKLAEIWGEDATVYVEQRRRSNTAALMDYIARLEAKKEPTFNWARFSTKRMDCVAKGTQPGLAIADALAHGTQKAIEPDERWGHVDHSLFAPMRPKLYSRHGHVVGHGFTVMPTPHYNGNHPGHFPKF